MLNGARDFAECCQLLTSPIPREVSDFIDSVTLKELQAKDPKSEVPFLWHILLRSTIDKEVGCAFSKRIMDYINHLTIEDFRASPQTGVYAGTTGFWLLLKVCRELQKTELRRFVYKLIQKQNISIFDFEAAPQFGCEKGVKGFCHYFHLNQSIDSFVQIINNLCFYIDDTMALSSLMGSEPANCLLHKATSHQNKAFLQVILSRFSGIFPEDYIVALQSQEQVPGSTDLMPLIVSRNTLFEAVASKPLTDDAARFTELKDLALTANKAGYTFACHYLASQYALQGCFVQALEIARMAPKYSAKQIYHFNFELASQHYQTFLASPLDDRTESLKEVLRYSVACNEDDRVSLLQKLSVDFVMQKRDSANQCTWQLNPLYLQVSHDSDEAACQWWVDFLVDAKDKFEKHEVRHSQSNSLAEKITQLKTELQEKQNQLALKRSDANSNFQKISTMLTQFESQLKGLKAAQPLTTDALREKFELSRGNRRKASPSDN